MKCKSFHTKTPDAYDAGLMIGESLAEIQPEVILLFSSIHYDFPELFDGIYSICGSRDIIIFGGTSDGFYETGGVSDYGAGALGINSEGKIRWAASLRGGGTEVPYETARDCAGEVVKQLENTPAAAFVFADLPCDGAKVVKGAREILKCPFIGGLTGDEWQFKKGYVFLNGKAYRDSVGILGMDGDIPFAVNSASGWKPMGKAGNVEKISGNIIQTIDGKTALEFIEEQFGMPPAESTLGLIPLAAYETGDDEHFFLRTPSKMDVASGRITYFGSIEEGTPVRVCNATEEDVVHGINDALEGMGEMGFEPLCAVVVSCGARKWLLGERTIKEVNRVFDYLGKTIPLVGFPSFGEMGPIRKQDGTYTGTLFHNVSYVILFIGAPK